MSKTRRPGKVIHDNRGNAIWDWAIEAEELSRTTTTGLLRTLSWDEPLALEGETKEPAHSLGGDPYNRAR